MQFLYAFDMQTSRLQGDRRWWDWTTGQVLTPSERLYSSVRCTDCIISPTIGQWSAVYIDCPSTRHWTCLVLAGTHGECWTTSRYHRNRPSRVPCRRWLLAVTSLPTTVCQTGADHVQWVSSTDCCCYSIRSQRSHHSPRVPTEVMHWWHNFSTKGTFVSNVLAHLTTVTVFLSLGAVFRCDFFVRKFVILLRK